MARPRLTRSTAEKKIAGVCAGIADYFDLDVQLVRVAWILAVVLGGVGVLPYLILWIVLPEDEFVAGPLSTLAIDIAEERFARGEITAAELAQIRSDLSS